MTEIATNRSEPLDFAQTFCRAVDARDRLAVVELADTSEMDAAEVRQELAEDTGAVDLDRLTEVVVFARACAGIFGSARGSHVTRTWVGALAESATLVHVTCRARWNTVPDHEGSAGVISLRRRGDGWRVLLNGSGPRVLRGYGSDMYVIAGG